MDDQQIIAGLKPICRCNGINRRTLLKHIDAGINTLRALQEITGAGSGSCRGKQCTARIIDLLQSFDRQYRHR
ncbi:MAG: (2Fe-2S)-binding protein [Desulfobacteraceae bacterium]